MAEINFLNEYVIALKLGKIVTQGRIKRKKKPDDLFCDEELYASLKKLRKFQIHFITCVIGFAI
ncbi:MAG: hypothetical protein ACRCUS_05400, partial [Anaerovoracaceae bacterium]